MGRIEKTVFVSYRRTDEPWGLAIFQDLTQHGYDVFIDYDGIASGNFATVILENIRARAHFLVLLTPTALERCRDPKDWMRREIEAALDSRRNIVPLMLAGFDFGTPAIVSQLTGKLAALNEYNGLEIPKGYFSPAMERLRNKFLSVSLDTVLHPASLSAQQAAKEQKDKATMALGEAPHQPRLSPEERRKQEETAAQHPAEEERRRQDAEIKQPADEEERRRKAEAEKRQRDEEERRRQEIRQSEARRTAEEERRGPVVPRWHPLARVGVVVGALMIVGGVFATVQEYVRSRSGSRDLQSPTSIRTQELENPQLIIVQTKLKELGLFDGSIDGIMGPQLRTAVAEFQRRNGLDPDGIVGPATYVKIMATPGTLPNPTPNTR
jgi:putative peptidoglycan binding protein/TIR domain-containing protein